MGAISLGKFGFGFTFLAAAVFGVLLNLVLRWFRRRRDSYIEQ
jgi:hypothetical protein